MRKTNKCCLCDSKFEGYGNNPDPLSNSGVCCDSCNDRVLDARLKELYQQFHND